MTGERKSEWILEIEHCDTTTPIEQCLAQNYINWEIETDMTHLFIELVANTVHPDEHIQFNGKKWELTSMVVFDCSHFISYLKQKDTWYLYDDTRSLAHISLTPYEFGKFYTKGNGCRFQYGVQNTFFFYVVCDGN
jgi:hypothetical protein